MKRKEKKVCKITVKKVILIDDNYRKLRNLQTHNIIVQKNKRIWSKKNEVELGNENQEKKFNIIDLLNYIIWEEQNEKRENAA